jgi:hypothetical protein
MCLSKRFEEDYDDAIFVYESTIEVKIYNPTNWRKDQHPSLRAAGGNIGKPEHGFKVHLFDGISSKGLTPLIVFKGKICSVDFQNHFRIRYLYYSVSCGLPVLCR